MRISWCGQVELGPDVIGAQAAAAMPMQVALPMQAAQVVWRLDNTAMIGGHEAKVLGIASG